MDLVIRVKEIVGHCPVYKVGDTFVLEEGYKINPQKSCTICIHSLASIMPYHVALSRGVDPKDIGLAREGNKAYVQYPLSLLELNTPFPLDIQKAHNPKVL